MRLLQVESNKMIARSLLFLYIISGKQSILLYVFDCNVNMNGSEADLNWLQLSPLKASPVSATQCLSRRCLANNFIDKDLYSAPQLSDCTINVKLTTIQYESLAFVSIFSPLCLFSFSPLGVFIVVFVHSSCLCKDLQSLHFSSHLKVYMVSPILFIHI